VLGKLLGIFKPTIPSEPFQDAVLGAVEYNAEESRWEARVASGGDALLICIAGKAAPDPRLLEHARAVASDRQAFLSLVSTFLGEEAPKFPDAADEIRSLRLESLSLLWPDRPNDGMIYFDGGDEDRVWRCDYRNRKPVGLGFDS
jgi:hypothetical protein